MGMARPGLRMPVNGSVKSQPEVFAAAPTANCDETRGED